jgi:hypothetical protein
VSWICNSKFVSVVNSGRDQTGRRGRRRKHLLDDFKETIRYWKLKVEALDGTVCRDRFRRGYGPSVRRTAI